ncbi:unnamed protein product [Didymodactylos carnosus]|uniref:DUF547 domain-containing protein n=1 Tax=Didymodactylos carnosus TaxID=1234261 RepID=A0A814ABT9_9BILA|nr:unnamed protein product [Didymodactylos carnosus]CAF3691670.1 unnamed protein product [Didymodactylos carnosus]
MSRYARSNSSRPFYRVKVINGVCPDEITDNSIHYLLNVLNCTPQDKFKITNNGEISTVKTSDLTNIENKQQKETNENLEPKSKNGFNAVQLSIELQKKMLNLKASFIDASGRNVNYIRLRKSSTYVDYYDIEHGILRGNKPHSNCTQRHFTYNDPRAKYSMRKCDPRIHFALNCGAKSCPQIAIYSSTNLEKALNMATTSFCNGEVDIVLDNQEIRMSKLFLWYRSDFGRSETEVLRWIAKYIDEPKQSLLKTLLDKQGAREGLRISYKTYDWMLNNHDGEAPVDLTVDKSLMD